MIIRAKNLLTTYAQPTYLSNGESTGASTLRVRNIAGFNANYAVQVGATGENTAEIVLLGASAPSGTALSLTGTTLYNHATDTPVYPIKFDKVIFYISNGNGTAGTAVPISIPSGTIPITPGGTTTNFDYTLAQSTDAFKTAWYNSVSTETSGLSSWITPAGFQNYSLGKLRQRVKDKLFNASYIPADIQIDDWVNEWLEEMTNSAIKVNEGYNMGSTNVTFNANTELGTITATDFKQIRRYLYTEDGNNYYLGRDMRVNNVDPNDIYDGSMPYFAMYGDNVIMRQPHVAAGTAALLYYKLNPILVNDSDTLPLSMQGYTKGFVDYAVGQARAKDNLDSTKDEAKAEASRQMFLNEITPRNNTNTATIDLPESVSAMDDDLLWPW